jgi:predicted Zn-dependent protease
MLGKQKLKQIASRVFELTSADQAEVIIAGKTEHLTRFAANTIHQNVSEIDVNVRVRVLVGGRRTGVASTNQSDPRSLQRVVESAETVARFQPANPDLPSLPEPKPIQAAKNAYVEATAMFTPKQRAEGAASILNLARSNGLQAAGAFSTGVQEYLVANSLGVEAYHRLTLGHLTTVVMGEDSSGYAEETALDVTKLYPEAVGRIAIDKALRGKNPSGIEPGSYTVILEQDAVADMIFYLGYMGMGALALQEKRSFMTGRLGRKVTGDNITIWDDGLDPNGISFPFDFEGVPKQKTMLIENGVAKGVVYDSFTAGREKGKQSTGHSLPAPNTSGPIPINLFMAPGSATPEEMVAATERGIWVTRFHYTNPVHPVKTVLTGMTRDGTFLIENGVLTRPLKNLRFTQSILDALTHADMLGSSIKMCTQGWGMLIATCVPAARIRNFTFTGTTEF